MKTFTRVYAPVLAALVTFGGTGVTHGFLKKATAGLEVATAATTLATETLVLVAMMTELLATINKQVIALKAARTSSDKAQALSALLTSVAEFTGYFDRMFGATAKLVAVAKPKEKEKFDKLKKDITHFVNELKKLPATVKTLCNK